MKITVVGLGYVGTVSLACLASHGHEVWGVDINPQKLESLNAGIAPIVEPDLQEALNAGRQKGGIHVSRDVRGALAESDLCFVSVATPSLRNGQINPGHLLQACRQIAQALRELGRCQIVAIRSSVLPAVLADVHALFAREAPGLVQLCVNPEFLREGSAIADFENPPFTVIGTQSAEVVEVLKSAYRDIAAPVYVLSPAEATLVKYASNAFHALKVTFANEIAALCGQMGLDGEAVMDVFCRDTKLNISRRYLRPGFAFGGSCLPKDVRALQYAGRLYDVDLPLMRSILESNAAIIRNTVQVILESGARRVTLVGLSFKKNTDDLRESPFVELAEQLIGKGVELRIYDPNVNIARLTGGNRDFINTAIPHLARLLTVSVEDAMESAELVIVGHRYSEWLKVLDQVRPDSPYSLIDLTGQMRLIAGAAFQPA